MRVRVRVCVCTCVPMTVMVKSCLLDLYASVLKTSSIITLKNVVVNRLTCVASHQVTLMRSASSLVCSPIRLKGYKAHLCGLEDVVSCCVCDGLAVPCFGSIILCYVQWPVLF